MGLGAGRGGKTSEGLGEGPPRGGGGAALPQQQPPPPRPARTDAREERGRGEGTKRPKKEEQCDLKGAKRNPRNCCDPHFAFLVLGLRSSMTLLNDDNKGLSPHTLGLSGRVLLKGPLGGAFRRG